MFIGVKNARRARDQRRQNVNRVLEANVQRNQRPTTPQPHQQQQNGEAALLQQQHHLITQHHLHQHAIGGLISAVQSTY